MTLKTNIKLNLILDWSQTKAYPLIDVRPSAMYSREQEQQTELNAQSLYLSVLTFNNNNFIIKMTNSDVENTKRVTQSISHPNQFYTKITYKSKTL